MMLGPELDCMETRCLNQVASAQVENGVDCTSEETDGRVGEAAGKEGGESGRGAVVRAAWAWAKGFAVEAWRGKRRRKRHNQ